MSNRSTINSTRLSVALSDLPLTPFGMKASHVTKNNPLSARNNPTKSKASKLRLKSIEENQNLSDLEGKENWNFLNNLKNVSLRRNRKKRQQQETCYKEKPHLAQNKFPLQPEVTYTIDSVSVGRSNRRESLFTDIDEGSFVEFTGTAVPKPPQNLNKEAVNQLYYTCSEENETKYSTSSKEPSSPVGFRKFIDKLRNIDKSKCIAEEVSLSEERSDMKGNFNLDETVITGSRDIMSKRDNKNCINVIMNSTVNNLKSKFVPKFPDISTLSLNKLETSNCSNHDINLCTNKSAECIVVSESDDECQHIKVKQKNKSLHHLKSQDKNALVIGDPIEFVNLESSLISEDISLAPTVLISKERNDCPGLKSKSPVNANKNNIHNFDNECEEENNSYEVDDRLVGWILNSPFKDSSFGTSFVNDKEIGPNIERVNTCISSQSLDLRLSDDFSPGKASGRTVFTLGRVPESPEIEDVPCKAKKIIPYSVINNDQNTINNRENENSFCNFVPEEHLNYSEENVWQRGFTKVKTKNCEQSCLNNVTPNSFSKATENIFRLNLSKNNENSSSNYEFMREEYRKKSLSADAINQLSYVSDEEYPSAGELYNSSISEEKTCKLKHKLNFSLSKSDSELNASNDKGYRIVGDSSNSISEKETRKHKVRLSITHSKSNENLLNNSAEPSIVESSSDSGNHEEVNSKIKLLNQVQSSFLNRKTEKKTAFILESSDDSLPDINVSNCKSKTSKLLDDLMSTIEGKLNISEASTPKSKLLLSNLGSISENFNKEAKSAPVVNESFISSDSSDSFENYIQSVKKKAKPITYKKTKSPINDSDFIVSDSDDVQYVSPLTTNKIKYLTLCNTNPGIKEHKTIENKWRKPPKIIFSSSESEEDYLPIEDSKVIPKQKNIKKKQKVNKQSSTIEVEKNKTPKSFLSSLTPDTPLSEAHIDAIPFIKNFKKLKESLTTKLYDLFNESVFGKQLPSSMNIKWNPRMTKTAGFCYYQIDKSKPMGRGSRIELSSKVIDAPGRLRDTLIHELCHAASWIISGYKDGHGPIWKSWASKARRVFPELPVISRCHSYKVHCKYTYKCVNCGYSIGRHSKSLDIEKKVCGYCYGKFELIVNYQGKGSSSSKPTESLKTQGVPPTPQTPRTPNRFALFVKSNYGSVKKSQTNLKHKDVMKVLSEQFSKMKTSEKLLL